MALTYQVKAKVFDIASDSPRDSDKFLLDTNVLFWSAYSNAAYLKNGPQIYQATEYEAFLKRVKTAGGQLYWCGLSLPEVAHRIEMTEFELAKGCGAFAYGNIKEYRHSARDEWKRVVEEVKDAWGLVTTLALPLDPGIIVNESLAKNALDSMTKSPVGAYDVYILDAVRTHALTGIISDDGDFSTVHGLTLATANRSVLAQGKAQGRVFVRPATKQANPGI